MMDPYRHFDLMIDLFQLLHDYKVTYNDADRLLRDARVDIETKRECIEYKDGYDYEKGIKSCDIGDEIIPPLKLEKMNTTLREAFKDIIPTLPPEGESTGNPELDLVVSALRKIKY